jgi:hypothetical protein
VPPRNEGPSLHSNVASLATLMAYFFELYVKKFVNGDGSVITLAIDAKNTTFNDYVVYATYDQGSTKGFLEVLPLFIYVTRTGIWTYIIYFTLAEFVVFAYLRHRKTIKSRKIFLQQITQEMMDVRKSLRHDQLSSDTTVTNLIWETGDLTRLYDFSSSWNLFRSYNRPFRYIKDKHKIFRETNGYIRIDDFYSKLVERDSYIKNSQVINDFTLAELNRQCLELAEDALLKIDCSKYR